MISRLSQLLSAADSLSIHGEYKLWIYRNYILSLLRFHLCVDAVSHSAISKMESMAARYLKKWLQLPRSSTRVILYYPGVCCPSISTLSREAKLNLLSCVSASLDLQLQELGVQYIYAWVRTFCKSRTVTTLFYWELRSSSLRYHLLVHCI